MCDDITEADLDRAGLPVRRREFGALVGAGAIASMLPAAACAAEGVQGRDVEIATADGTCDAYFTARSEEHTSELQSLMRISYDVFCLKKTQLNNIIHVEQHITTSERHHYYPTTT